MVRNSAVVSLEQECQKLKGELVDSEVEFERQVGNLKEKMQQQKTDLEVHKLCSACRFYVYRYMYVGR